MVPMTGSWMLTLVRCTARSAASGACATGYRGSPEAPVAAAMCDVSVVVVAGLRRAVGARSALARTFRAADLEVRMWAPSEDQRDQINQAALETSRWSPPTCVQIGPGSGSDMRSNIRHRTTR